MNIGKFIEVKKTLVALFILNSGIQKGYGTNPRTTRRDYRKKDFMIRKIISYIREYQLPIKYGQNDNVVYFCVDGVQFSFHGYYTGKQYNGNWQGNKIKNKQMFIWRAKRRLRF